MLLGRIGAFFVGVLVMAGCAHSGSPEEVRAREDRAIRIAAYSTFLVGKGREDESPVVNCLGYTKLPSQGPPNDERDVEDEDPEVLKAFDSRPEYVAPFSVCRRPSAWHQPFTVSGKVVEYVRKIEIEWVERPTADTAVVAVGVIPVQLNEPPGIFYGRGTRIWLTRVGGVWTETGREDGWRT